MARCRLVVLVLTCLGSARTLVVSTCSKETIAVLPYSSGRSVAVQEVQHSAQGCKSKGEKRATIVRATEPRVTVCKCCIRRYSICKATTVSDDHSVDAPVQNDRSVHRISCDSGKHDHQTAPRALPQRSINYLFSTRVTSTWYTTIASKLLSKRSKTPPCPGMMCPASLA